MSTPSPSRLGPLHQLRPNTKPTDFTLNFQTHQPTPPGSHSRPLSSNPHAPNRSLSDFTQVRHESLNTRDEEGRLKKEVLRLRECIDSLETENMALQKNNIEYQNEIGIWQDKTRRLNDELVELEKREVQHTPRYQDFVRRHTAIAEEEKAQLKRTIQELSTNQKNSQQVVAGLRGELDATRRELANSKSIEGLYAKLQEDYMSSQGELRALQKRDKDRQVEVFRLEGQVEQMSRRLDESSSFMQEQKIALKREKQSLQRRLADTAGTYQAAKRQLIETAGDVTDLRDNEAELKRVNTNLQREVEEVKTQNLKLAEQFKQLQRTKEDMRSSMPDMATIREESAAFRARIIELESSCRQEERQSEAYRIENISLRNSLDAARNSLQELQKQRRSLQSTTAKQEVWRKREEELETIRSQQRAELLSLSSKLETADFTIRNLERQIKETVHESRFANSTKDEENRLQMQSFKSQNRAALKEVQNLKQRKNEIETELLETKQLMATELQSVEEREREALRKLRESEYLLGEMKVENERWKNYRHSDDEEVRRQIKVHKKRADELEQQLRFCESQDIKALEELRSTCERLTDESQQQQEKNQLNIANLKVYYEEEAKRESAMFHQAMDEMEEQSKNILRECSIKLEERDSECDKMEAQIVEQREELKLLTNALGRQQEKVKSLEGQLREHGVRHHNREAQISRLEVENQREIQKSRYRSEVDSHNHHRDAAEMDRLQRELERAQKMLKSSESNNADLQIELERAQKLLRASELTISDMQYQVDKLQKDLRVAEASSIDFRRQVQNKEHGRYRLDRSLEEKINEIQHLKIQNNRLSEELIRCGSTRKELNHAQAETRRVQQELAEEVYRNGQLRKELDGLEGQIRTLNEMKVKLVSDNCAFQKEIQRERSIGRELQNAMRELNSNNQRQKARISRQKEDDKTASDRERARMAREIEELNRDNSKIRQIKESYVGQSREAERQLKEEKQRFNTEVSALGREVAELKEQVERLRDEGRVLDRQNRETKEENQRLASQVRVLQDQNEHSKQTKDKYLLEMRTLERQLRSKEELDQRVLQVTADLAKERNKYLKKVEEYNHQSQNCKQWKEKNYENQAKVNDLTKQLEQAETTIRVLNKTTDELKGKLSAVEQILQESKEEAGKLREQSRHAKDLDRTNSDLKEIIARQDGALQALNTDRTQMTHEIEILLKKLGVSEDERRQRLATYGRIASLNAFTWPVCQGDQVVYLQSLLQSCRVAGNRLKDTAITLEGVKKELTIMGEERETLNRKYLKYKTMALQLRDRKENHKKDMRNNYRYNEEIITHCQNLIDDTLRRK